MSEPFPFIPFMRFSDLKAAKVVNTWQQLRRMVENYDFPEGVLLSPNVRAWRRDEVEDWLKNRPVERKIVARLRRRLEPRDETRLRNLRRAPK
jgi:hypothetical protein